MLKKVLETNLSYDSKNKKIKNALKDMTVTCAELLKNRKRVSEESVEK